MPAAAAPKSTPQPPSRRPPASPEEPAPKSLRSASISPLLPASAPLRARALRHLVRLGQGLRIHNAFGAAPAMSFHFFLSLIPVLVLVGFILGQLVRKNGVEALLGPVLDSAPDAAETVVRHELERLAGSNVAPLAPLSVIGFLWLASSGTQGLMDVFELAVGAPRRAWWKQRAIALVWVMSALLSVALVGWSLVKIDAALHRGEASRPVATAPVAPRAVAPPSAGHRVEREAQPESASRGRKRILTMVTHAPWERGVALTALCVIGLCALASFYRFAVEHPRGVKRRVWPGALSAIAAWLVVSWAFGEYVSSLGKYTLFYGSVAAVAVLLIWFYLTSWSLLLGAEVNAQLEGIRDVQTERRARARTHTHQTRHT
jgi:membrane protein